MSVMTIHDAPLHVGLGSIWRANQILQVACDSQKIGGDEGEKKKGKLVITPGGPRPAEQVHRVEPGQIVRRNPDGTYSIVPETAPDSNK
jgi:hypothetical protein